jgi:hypothetical protein
MMRYGLQEKDFLSERFKQLFRSFRASALLRSHLKLHKTKRKQMMRIQTEQLSNALNRC